MTIYSINLTEEEQNIVNCALGEYGGGYSRAMANISDHSETEIKETRETWRAIRTSENNEFVLEEKFWRVIYDSINATLYALGPHELETITGYGPLEFLQTNLVICSRVWGAYSRVKWTTHHQITRI